MSHIGNGQDRRARREVRWLVCLLALTATLVVAAESGVDHAGAEACYQRGLAAKHDKKMDEAEAQLREATQLDPGHMQAHWALAWVLSGQGAKPEAAEEFRIFLRLKPSPAQAKQARDALERLGEPEVETPEPVTPAVPHTPATPTTPPARPTAPEPVKPPPPPPLAEPTQPLAAGWGPRHLVVVGHDGTAFVWNGQAHPLVLKPAVEDVTCAAISADAANWALGGRNGHIRLYDATGSSTALELGGLDEVRALAFSPEGDRLAAVLRGGRAVQYDLRQQRRVAQRDVAPDTVSVALGADPARLWLAGPTFTGVAAWASGETSPLPVPFQTVCALTESRCVTAGEGGAILELTATTGATPQWQLQRTWAGHGGTVRATHWCAESGHLTSVGDDKLVRCWDGAGRGELLLLRLYDKEDWAAWSPTGHVEGTEPALRALRAEVAGPAAEAAVLDAGWLEPTMQAGLLAALVVPGETSPEVEAAALGDTLSDLSRDLRLAKQASVGRLHVLVAPFTATDDPEGFRAGCQGAVLAGLLANKLKGELLGNVVYDGEHAATLAACLPRNGALGSDERARLLRVDSDLDLIVSGSVEQRGTLVRIALQLMRASDGQVVATAAPRLAILDATDTSMQARSFTLASAGGRGLLPSMISSHTQNLPAATANGDAGFYTMELVQDGRPATPMTGYSGQPVVDIQCGTTFQILLTNRSTQDVGIALLIDGKPSIVTRQTSGPAGPLWVLKANSQVLIPGWWVEGSSQRGSFRAFRFGRADGSAGGDERGTIVARFYTKQSELAIASAGRGPVVEQGSPTPGSASIVPFASSPVSSAERALWYREGGLGKGTPTIGAGQ